MNFETVPWQIFELFLTKIPALYCNQVKNKRLIYTIKYYIISVKGGQGKQAGEKSRAE
jgi:hypothetical protein